MYSRFTLGPDGSYQRKQVPGPSSPAPKPEAPPNLPAKSEPAAATLRSRLTQLLPQELELGDVLVLLVTLLLLVDAEEDFQSILITAAAYFLM